jgi:hypothetical protein
MGFDLIPLKLFIYSLLRFGIVVVSFLVRFCAEIQNYIEIKSRNQLTIKFYFSTDPCLFGDNDNVENSSN